jgi:hypothetical protein
MELKMASLWDGRTEKCRSAEPNHACNSCTAADGQMRSIGDIRPMAADQPTVSGIVSGWKQSVVFIKQRPLKRLPMLF